MSLSQLLIALNGNFSLLDLGMAALFGCFLSLLVVPRLVKVEPIQKPRFEVGAEPVQTPLAETEMFSVEPSRRAGMDIPLVEADAME